MRKLTTKSCHAALAAGFLLWAGEALAIAPYTAPTGDLNLNGAIDVQDIQCEVLTFTQVVLAGTPNADQCATNADCQAQYGPAVVCRKGFTQYKICLPDCLNASVSLGASASVTCNNPAADDADCLGLVQKKNADLNCDGKISNVDFLFLVAIVMEKVGGPTTGDYDSDGRLNFCDDDSDADGDPDVTDCGKLDPTVNSLLPEVCDGDDNDCDDLVDGLDPNVVADQACEIKLGVCNAAVKPGERCHNGTWLPCTDDDYLASNADFEAVEASCDDLDNDCDGLVDEADPDVPGCGCQSDADCTSLDAPSTCTTPAQCQGARLVGTCIDTVCQAVEAADDSACTAQTEASGCGLYLPVYCAGGEVQGAPPACASFCILDSDCDDKAHCNAGTCSLDAGVGQGCLEDSDCVAAAHCDEATGQCVADSGNAGACAVDSDCAAGFHCEALTCVADVAVGGGCVLDSDCADGAHCDEAAAQCVADGEEGVDCVVASDCAPELHCEAGTCVEDAAALEPCATDSDCADGLHCDEAAGLCEQDGGNGAECAVDSDCAPDFHCEAGACAQDVAAGGACGADSDCAAGYHCDEGAAECVADSVAGALCVVDSDCAEGYHCSAEACVEDAAAGDPCVVDSDCAEAYHCDEAAGSCAADAAPGDQCILDSDCAEGFHCEAAVCAQDAVGGENCAVDSDCALGYTCDEAAGTCQAEGAAGADCTVDPDCAADYHCEDATCVEDAVGGETCAVDSDCAAGFHCNEAVTQCEADGGEQADCAVDSDCAADYHCAAGSCTEDAAGGQGCAVDSDCADGYHCDEASQVCAVDGTDQADCLVDSDCADGFHCEAESCTADGVAGQGCDADSDCAEAYHCDAASGQCAADVPAGGQCAADSDCAQGYHCEAGACAEDAAGGQACAEDADCAEGYHCDEAQTQCAADSGPEGPCAVDSDCAQGYHCAGGACVENVGPGGACAADPDCADGYHCDEGAGNCAADQAPGGLCGSDDDCVEGYYCTDGQCAATVAAGAPCAQESNCGPGYHCDAVCTQDVADGAACDESSDCVSDNCSNDTCCTAGKECCQVAADCGPPAELPVCDDLELCQGHAYQAACVGFQCVAQEIASDVGCGVDIVVSECAPFAPVTCTGQAVQPFPGACPTTCADEAGCLPGNVCSPQGGCEPPICTLQGTAGQVVDCPLHLATKQAGLDSAVQIQFWMDYDDAKATVDALATCGQIAIPFPCTLGGNECDVFGDPDFFCDPVSLTCHECTTFPPDSVSAKLPSGHSIETCMKPPPNCKANSLFVLVWGTESAPITTAYMQGGAVVGSSGFVTIRFKLDQNVPAAIPVSIAAKDFAAANGLAQSLPLEVKKLAAGSPGYVIVSGVPVP
jgi:hypothetical protein